MDAYIIYVHTKVYSLNTYIHTFFIYLHKRTYLRAYETLKNIKKHAYTYL